MNIKKATQFLAIATVGVSLSLVSACGNSAVKEIESIADEACACKDMQCLSKVQKKMATVAGKLTNKSGNKDDGKRLMEAMKRVTLCTTKIVEGTAE